MDAVVISDVFGTKAGAYMATLLLCRALDELEIKVTCFTTWVDPDHPVDSEAFAVVKPWVTRGYRWDCPNRSLAFQAIRHIKKYKPTVVIVVGVTRLCRYVLDSAIAEHLLIWELTNGCGNKFVDVKASKLLSRCRAVLSPSLTIDHNIRAHYNFDGDIRRLPFWVEEQNSQSPARTDQFLCDFIFFGRRDEEKGLRELIQATAIVVREYPDVKVVVGGVGEAEPFASMARDLDVEENISFDSFPSQRDVGEAMTNSRCLVLPSYHEGYPLVLLEAARSSLPAIATGVGSIREVFGESQACIIVEPRDAGSLARGMQQILGEPVVAFNHRKKAAYKLFNQLSSSEVTAENLNSILQFARSTQKVSTVEVSH